MALGNPSDATRSLNNPNNFLVIKPQFVLSYNKDKGGPNWVSWHVERSDLGHSRHGDFEPDPDLPERWRIRPTDYVSSGYDRGTMCPPSDRNNSDENSQAVYLMSNILPQRPDLNRGPWQKLEEYSRSLVMKGSELYIIAGGYGTRGEIAHGLVNVPERNWKIIVVLPQGNNDIDRINSRTRVIAVDMPNRQGLKVDIWSKHITTVELIEAKTGYRFFTNLPEDIREKLIKRRDKIIGGTRVRSLHRGI
jgi:endonuclease G